VKLGAELARVEVMGEAGLTPPVLASGRLEDGTTILVQPLVEGRTPRAREFLDHLEQVARMVSAMHQNEGLKGVLPAALSQSYRDAGRAALTQLRERWELYAGQVPDVAGFVNASLERINLWIESFTGEGLVASHNDISNPNWLLTPEGRLYIIDLDLMAMDDSAYDTGALLWWYYPPEARSRFLSIAGYADTEELRGRMQTRMAMHCLRITLPREGSFDTFDPASYPGSLADFRAVLKGEENPQGYWRHG
jgi:thiamine kinase-like enzyme